MAGSRYQLGHTPAQSVVEFALIAPLLIIMLLGTFDFALAMSHQMAIRSAVAEGGYYIAQHPDDQAGAEQQIRMMLRQLPSVTDSERLVVAFTSTACMSSRQDTTVEVRYLHDFWFSAVLPAANVTLRDSTTVPQFGSCE
jgi:hypothetical protein